MINNFQYENTVLQTAVLWYVTIFQKHLPWVFFWTWPTFGHSWRYTWRTIRIIRWITGRGARIGVRRRSQFSQFFILACLFLVIDFRTKAFSLEGNSIFIFWSNATEIARQILLAKYLTYGLTFWSTIVVYFIKGTADDQLITTSILQTMTCSPVSLSVTLLKVNRTGSAWLQAARKSNLKFRIFIFTQNPNFIPSHWRFLQNYLC